MERMFMKGNEAIAEAAIRCGCRFFFGYPITPQSDIPEYMSAKLPKLGGAFVQPCSEVAASNMISGAAATGARVLVSSSSVGIAHMQESISNMAGCEIPGVFVNVSRGGPGVGNLFPSQGDYNQATRGGGNGDYHVIVLSPSSLQECCDLVQHAFDLSEKYRNPVMILADAMTGQIMESVEIREVEPVPYDKSWCLGAPWGEGRAINDFNSMAPGAVNSERLIRKLADKYDTIAQNEKLWEEVGDENPEYIIVSHGVVGRMTYDAIDMLAEAGIKAKMFRPVTVWPWPYEELYALAAKPSVKAVVCCEMAVKQMYQDVRIGVNGVKPVVEFSKLGGETPMPQEICAFVQNLKEGN